MDARGFCLHRGALDSRELHALRAALEARRGRAGARHLMRVSEVAEIAVRLAPLAGGRIPYRATLFDKSLARNWLAVWHQDSALPLARRFDHPDWGPWSRKDGVDYAHAPAWALERVVALRAHLDASTPDNGPLRVIPGSHELGVLRDDEIFTLTREREPFTSLAAEGDVWAMKPLLLHASEKARVDAPRRVLHIEYADSLTLASGIELTRA